MASKKLCKKPRILHSNNKILDRTVWYAITNRDLNINKRDLKLGFITIKNTKKLYVGKNVTENPEREKIKIFK